MQYRGAGYENLIVYGYDKNGNITKAGAVTYAYDEAGQLIRVNDLQNGTTVYVYNQKGNIAAVQSYDYTVGELGTCKNTVSYTYGNSNWSDQLTSYNGQAITYDGAGNPTYYKSAQLSWKNGRYLSSYAADGYSVEYAYNAQGLRTYKKYEYQQDSGETHTTPFTYTYDANGRLTGQWYYDVPYFYFYYDKAGNPIALEYGGTVYYYVKNLQGDIIALLDRWGNCVVEYTYDAWGKVLSVTGSMAESLGNDNPLRYRGYYYDRETGLYYLQSRYYDPETGRFISADGVNMLLSGEQAYTYCGNNPINRSDPTGESVGYENELMILPGWTDTILHLGLSPDGFYFNELLFALSYNIAPEYNVMCAVGGTIAFSFSSLLIDAETMAKFVHGVSEVPLSDTARNYYHNIQEQRKLRYKLDYIYDQSLFADWKFGLTNLSSSGCGIVAAYNALVILGRQVDLASLIALEEYNGYLPFGAVFGVCPFDFKTIAKIYGLEYRSTKLLEKIDNVSSQTASIFDENQSVAAIIWQLNNIDNLLKGMHYFTFTKISENGGSKYVSYNRYFREQKESRYDSLQDVFTPFSNKSKLIQTYFFIDKED